MLLEKLANHHRQPKNIDRIDKAEWDLASSYAAVRDMDMRRTIALITAPTLVIAGRYDTVTLPSHSELIAATAQGAKLVILPVVHLSNLEAPNVFINAAPEFLR